MANAFLVPAVLERFGPYQTERLLGRGGMGAVYLARRADGQFEQTVAVKVMAAHLAGEDFLRKFRSERQLLATLAHPNIARLLDGGVSASGDPYLAMEYVAGLPLDTFCDQGRLGIEARLRLFLQVCEAVDFAHRQLILHRDLKPANILVTSDGTVKLLDFGTASLMSEDAAAVTVTRARMLTPRYASPEQLRGEPSSIAADVFSLGVMLYETLTGAWPFGTPGSLVGELQRATGEAVASLPWSAVSAEAADLRSAPRDRLRRLLRGDLSAIALRALENHPSRRYSTVRQLADDIGRFLDGHPVLARPQTRVYRAGKFLRRHWLAVSAAALFAIGIASAAVVAVYQARAASHEALKAEQVNRFLTNMLSSAGRNEFDAQKYTVSQMLDSAEQRLEKGSRSDPLTEAILHRSLASSYYALLRYDNAKFHLDRAVAVFEALGEERELVLALQLRAQSAETQGQYDAAIQILEQVLAHLRHLGGNGPQAEVFRAKTLLATVLSFDLNWDLDRARRLFQEAISLAGRDSSIPRTELATAMSKWGAMLGGEGKQREAEAVFMNALATGRKEDPCGYWEFDPLYQLAVLHAHRHDNAAAKEFARQMIDVTARAVGPDNAATAEAKLVWAAYAAETGEGAAAVRSVMEAMPVIEKNFPSPSLNLWHSARDSASVLRLAGRYTEAEHYARESLAVAQAARLSQSDPRLANSWDQLGRALCEGKKYPEGIRALEQAAAIYAAAGGAWTKTAETARGRIAEFRKAASAAH